jgi:serralysin
MTIWDGGGVDTYDFSNYSNGVTVNLQPGSWSTASSGQLASLGNGRYAAGNIANAMLYNNNPASLIENAVGGSGADKLTGNIANNGLKGGSGNDVLDGATGTDTAVYTGTFADYSIVKNSDGSWSVADLRSGSPDGTDKLWNIELLQFSDSLKVVGDLTLEPPAPPPPPPPEPPPPTEPPPTEPPPTEPQPPSPPTAAQTIIGSSSADTIYGTAGNDKIDGLAGNDKIFGGAGADTIDGGAGKDYIFGGAGADVLTGGSDFDRFVFDAPLNSGIDRITDFSHSYDTIVLSHDVFTAFRDDGYIGSSAFYAGTAAHDASDRIIYNPATGAIMYDPDGNGPAAAVQFAQVDPGVRVTSTDFYVV